MTVIFLGAGFSYVGGVPLASELFDEKPIVDRIVRERLIERVLCGWQDWHKLTGETPEQYLCHLEQNSLQEQRRDAQWYIALNVTLNTPGVQIGGVRPGIYYHSLERCCSVEIHNQFWTEIFQRTEDVTVITTNYDLLAEQGLRPRPNPRGVRPGFHYGDGPEPLKGSVPGIFHKKVIEVDGSVPIFKLHGSVSWEITNHSIERFHDCRPAIKGSAAIIAPMTEKSIPKAFEGIWKKSEQSLYDSETWIIVGYSFPDYDQEINDLFKRSSKHGPQVHILNPDDSVAPKVQRILTNAEIHSHPGLPDALGEIPSMLNF